jgi:hypothetical protein
MRELFTLNPEAPYLFKEVVMNKNIFRSAWLICLALTFSLACLSGVGGQIEGVKETAQSAVEQGRSFISTAQAFATQSVSMLATARAFATEQAPLIETAKAFATAQGPELLQTAQAVSTEFAFGSTPEDIPLPPTDQIKELVSSNAFISFTALMPAKDVVAFYEAQMPLNGWQANGDTIESADSTILQYQKPGRQVYFVFNHKGTETQVVITLESK